MAFRPDKKVIAGGVAAVLVLVVGTVVALTGGGDDDKVATKPTTTTAPASTTSTTAPDPTIPDNAVLAPLTGLPLDDPLVGFRPALAVKIDNVDAGGQVSRPQAGIVDADVVFEEIVEGGITRLVAVFQSGVPDRVGPVRSARTTDPILLAQLNRPLFAWSGGNAGVASAVRNGPLRDFGWDAQPDAYARDSSRRAPHNLFLTPGILYDRKPDDARPPLPIFRFREEGAELPSTARAVKGVSLQFGGVSSVPVSFEYDPNVDAWRRVQKGTVHTDEKDRVVAPRNVVVLFTPYAPSPADPRSPEAQSVGSGEAWVLTKGHIIGGTWTRDNADVPARLTDQQGNEIALTPGQTWVELPRPGGATVLT